MTRYYEALNAGNEVLPGLRFEIVSTIGGTAYGVFETDDPALQAQLAGVSRVTEIEEELYRKKKRQQRSGLKDLPHSNFRSPQPAPAAVPAAAEPDGDAPALESGLSAAEVLKAALTPLPGTPPADVPDAPAEPPAPPKPKKRK